MSTANQLDLSACLLEVEPLRYTPAGVPAVNFLLEHQSQLTDAGQIRRIQARVKAMAFGPVAERVSRLNIGSSWQFRGFLSSPRGGRNLVFHVQEFVPI